MATLTDIIYSSVTIFVKDILPTYGLTIGKIRIILFYD